MLKFERGNTLGKSTLELFAAPGSAVIRTTGPGEVTKVVDLEGRFPRRLYNRLEEALNPKSTVYGTTSLRLPRQQKQPSLMVYPHDVNGERWVRLFWFENVTTTNFEIELRATEVRQLLDYIDTQMSC